MNNDYENLFGEQNNTDNEELIFSSDLEEKIPEIEFGKWKVLIVDDDEDIHNVTRLALDDFNYKNKKIEFIDTYSGKETEKILQEHPDIAIILLDVVMESTHAGLELVKYIRENIGNKLSRIILRTGQAGQAPEKEVIHSYEINDYKTKTELTANKLFTVILSSLRSYEALLELEAYSKSLEEKVKERTLEISAGIQYATKIQKAILPDRRLFENCFKDYFIFNLPRDFVSGDYYWIFERDNKVFFAVADCTGHGVPGAFMSLLGITFLNEILVSNKFIPANEILNELRKHIITAFQQKGETGEMKDGMDMSLCILDKEYNQLQYAGANNPLYIIRKTGLPDIACANITKGENANLFEIAPDRMPIGYYINQKPFKNNTIQLIEGDEIILFTDGFADQFGGPDAKSGGKKLKYKPLKNLLIKYHSESLANHEELLSSFFKEWKGCCEQIDDVCIMGIRV